MIYLFIQAYTMELEVEVERLKKENAKLKGQLKMVRNTNIDIQNNRLGLSKTLKQNFKHNI